MVGKGGGSLTWHLVPVGVNEIEGEGEVSTYTYRGHHHHYFVPVFTCWEPVMWHQHWHVEGYSGSCGWLWVVVEIGGGDDEPVWGGCVGWW